MKNIFFYILFLLPLLLQAQHQLRGTITDGAGHPLDGATVTMLKADKNIASGMADSGKFVLALRESYPYTLKVTLIGYRPFYRVLHLQVDTVMITMQKDDRSLTEVVVSGRKPIVERKIDRVTFNVENSVVASGGSVWDAIGKAPGVQAKPDNSITANRKDVQIYLDGKPLRLSGDELASYLQGLPADLVAKIDVYENPPAMFEAQGSTVINIVTKKTKKQGLNGTLNGGLTRATYDSYTASTSFNYRQDKINIFGNFGYSKRRFQREQNDYVTYSTPGNSSFWNSPSVNDVRSSSYNYRAGIDYQASKGQVIGFLFTGNNRSGSTLTNTPTTITSNGKEIPDSSLQTLGASTSKYDQYAFNVNYNLKTDSASALNIDLDYSPYRSARGQTVDNTTFLPDGTPTGQPYRISTPTTQQINIYSGMLDYSYKVGGVWAITSGFKYSSITSLSDFEYYNIAGPQPELVIANSDRFRYTENTAAVYTSVSAGFGSWSLQGGLRGENTRVRGYSETLDSVNRRAYFKLFPSLYIAYKISEQHELQLSYSYRVDRPGFALLNPAKHYTTPYDYLAGNPGLQPAFVLNVALGYTYDKSYNLTAYYTATHDMFSNVTVQDNANKLFYDTFENLGLSSNTGVRLTATFHPAGWWDISTTLDGFYQQEKSDYLQGSYDYHKWSYSANTTQSFVINKKNGLKAEFTAYYYAPGIQGIFKNGANSAVDAGIKADLFGGKGTIKLAAGDIFYSNVYRIKVDYQNQNNGFYQRNDTRNATISFSYRFGKNIAASRKRSTSSDEEKKRAQ